MKMYIAQVVNLVFTIMFWTLFVRILMSWFPNINWYQQPYKLLKEITDPILMPFQRIIPPIGGIDFSPMVPFLLIEVLRYVVIRIIVML